MGAVARKQVATILSGASLSNAVLVGGGLIARLQMPTGWDAADITVQASHDNVTYQELLDDGGNAITIKAAASKDVVVSPLGGLMYVKLRSGTSGAPVTQNADRAIGVVITTARLARR